MSIDIVDYTKQSVNRIIVYVYMGLFCIGILAMTGGPWSSKSLYAKFNVDTWVYFLTSFLIFIFLILAMNLFFSRIPVKGQLEFVDEGVKVKLKKNYCLHREEITYVKIHPDYLTEVNEGNKKGRIIEVVLKDKNTSEKFDVLLSLSEESQLNSIIKNWL